MNRLGICLLVVFNVACSDVEFSNSRGTRKTLSCPDCVDNLDTDNSDSTGNPPTTSTHPNAEYYLVEQTIQFQNQLTNTADILFVMDNSGSMDPDLEELANKFPNLITSISALDWRICVTTTDVYNTDRPGADGQLLTYPNGRLYLQKGDNQPQQQFVNLVNNIRDGETGSGNEQGVKAIYRTIERDEGCFREGASLSTVVVSDENEKGDGSDLGSKNLPDNLLQLIENSFGTEKIYTHHSIITRSGDDACLVAQREAFGSDTSARFGTVYEVLSGKTDGLIGDICANDYSSQLSFIGDITLSKTLGTASLNCTPLDASGQPVTDPRQLIVSQPTSSSITFNYTGTTLTLSSNEAGPVSVAIRYYCQK